MDNRIIFHVDCNSAFLSFSAVRRLQLGIDTVEVAAMLKDRIKSELGFTVSIGISSNKLYVIF